MWNRNDVLRFRFRFQIQAYLAQFFNLFFDFRVTFMLDPGRNPVPEPVPVPPRKKVAVQLLLQTWNENAFSHYNFLSFSSLVKLIFRYRRLRIKLLMVSSYFLLVPPSPSPPSAPVKTEKNLKYLQNVSCHEQNSSCFRISSCCFPPSSQPSVS